MVQPRDYIDGVRINWGRLSLSIVGASVFAYFRTSIATFLSIVDLPIAFVSGLTDFVSELYGVYFSSSAVLINQAFAGAIPFVQSSGIAGYIIALVVALATFYGIAWVISSVR